MPRSFSFIAFIIVLGISRQAISSEPTPSRNPDNACVGPRNLDASTLNIEAVATLARDSITYIAIFNGDEQHRVNCHHECSSFADPILNGPDCLTKNGCCDLGIIKKKVLPDSETCPSNARIAIEDRGIYNDHPYQDYTNQEIVVLYRLSDGLEHKVSCEVDRTCTTPNEKGPWVSTFGCIDLTRCCDRGIPDQDEAFRLEHGDVFRD